MYTDREYQITTQSTRRLHTKIYILNSHMQRCDEISGVVLDGASFNCDSNSDIRRTCSISLYPKNNKFAVNFGSNIWMDKYVQIYVGIESLSDPEDIVYTNMGVYIIENPSRTYDATTNTLTINGIDLMAKFTGLRNGYLEGVKYEIPAGSSIKGAMMNCVKLAGFTKYIIEEPSPTPTVPNKIASSLGDPIYNLMTQLRDINSNYQMYFDVDGVFHFERIPSGSNEAIMVDDSIWNKTLLSYTNDINFDDVKNYIEVFGKTQDIVHYADVEEVIAGMSSQDILGYNYHLPLITDITNEKGNTFGLIPQSTRTFASNTKFVSIEGEDGIKWQYNIRSAKQPDGTYPNISVEEGKYYVLKFMAGEDYWEIIDDDLEEYVASASLEDGVITIFDQEVKQGDLVDGFIMRFRKPQLLETLFDKEIKVNDLASYKVLNSSIDKDKHDTVTIKLHINSTKESERYFLFNGEVTPYGCAYDDNPESPFYYQGNLGIIRIVLTGDEYDNISSSDLAVQRAKYELYKRCKLQDSISINVLPIYWLDVNWIVSITLPNKNGETETRLYMTQSISTTLGVGGTQSITLARYYPFYPFN